MDDKLWSWCPTSLESTMKSVTRFSSIGPLCRASMVWRCKIAVVTSSTRQKETMQSTAFIKGTFERADSVDLNALQFLEIALHSHQPGQCSSEHLGRQGRKRSASQPRLSRISKKPCLPNQSSTPCWPALNLGSEVIVICGIPGNSTSCSWWTYHCQIGSD